MKVMKAVEPVKSTTYQVTEFYGDEDVNSLPRSNRNRSKVSERSNDVPEGEKDDKRNPLRKYHDIMTN